MQDFAADEASSFGVRAMFCKLASSIQRAGRLNRLAALGEETRGELVRCSQVYASKIFGLLRGVDATLGLAMLGVLQSLGLPGVDEKMVQLAMGEVQNGLLDLTLEASPNSGGPPAGGPADPWTVLHECARAGLRDVAKVLLCGGAGSCLSVKAPGGRDPIAWAAREGHKEVQTIFEQWESQTIKRRAQPGNGAQMWSRRVLKHI